MEYQKLRSLRKLIFFRIEDLVNLFGVRPESAHVLCARYVKDGLFVRIKNNFYVLEESWERLLAGDFFKISNYLQVPSYISFMTALSYYEISTQVQRDFFESASLKRSAKFSARGVDFNFYKLKKKYYFGFIKKNDLFIATPEKALVDSIYLDSFGKYSVDASSLDLRKIDKDKVKQIIKVFPSRTKEAAAKICGI